MNQKHPPGFDEREWQAQERAMQEERAGAVAGDDAVVAQYRRIARALRTAPPPDLPPGFAAELARRADLGDESPEGRLERGVLRVLLALLPLSGAVVAALYGPRLWRAATSMLGAEALAWAAAVVACAALSWSFEWLRRRDEDDGARGAAPA